MQVFHRYNPKAQSFGFFGSFTPTKITEPEFNKVYEECVKTIQSAKNKEEISAAFQKVLKDLTFDLPEYQTLMEKPYNELASIASGPDLTASENITEFTLNFNIYLSNENILTLAEAQEVQAKTLANETPKNIFKFIEETVVKAFKPASSPGGSDSSGGGGSSGGGDSSSGGDSSGGGGGSSGGGDSSGDKNEKKVAKASAKPQEGGMSTPAMLLLLGGGVLAVGGLVYFATKTKTSKNK